MNKRAFLVLSLALVQAAVAADEAPFIYDDHGKHDPFWPLVSSTGAVITYDTDLTASDMNLEGIVGDPSGNNVAIINGKMVKPKDVMGAYVVDVIADDHVEVINGQERFTLKLKKEGEK